MNFKEHVAADPLGAFSAVFVWVPIAVWVISMVHWMVTAEIETPFGLVAIGVAIGLGVVTASPPAPWLSPLIFTAVMVTVVVFPFVRTAVNRHALAAIDIEQLEKHYEALRMRPDNAGAMIKMAELLYIRGFPAYAVAIGERALVNLPVNLFRAEHQMVSAWKMQGASAPKGRLFPCLHCGFGNDPSEINCQQCGYPYVVEMAKGKWLGTGSGRKLIAVWIGLVIAFVGIPASASLAQRSPVLALTVIALQIVAAAVVVYQVFLKGGKNENA